ncbi:Cytochrome P450 [Caenorhabditis elegans]|uniref:Cytochrome P450 n=1 Tax=Caenorhabditis elegans TaxID=6239 RepID=Q27472_CAEEL|nr:Cytochrome P450 [Caenorhabditis elegans]CCD65767.1 Cytochrome P450 [Caenorhabditis elegans]|eukprot:NP_505009.4 CYtochrome P450 family [Caenorhabditis elegans]
MIIVISIVIGYVIYLVVVNFQQILELWRINRKCAQNLSMVNGPPALPLVGSAHLFKWNPYAFTFQMEGWAQKYLFGRAKYGEIAAPNNEVDGIMLLWIGPVPIVFLGTSECIRPVLESNTNISKPSQYDKMSEWIGTGLLTSTHEKWFHRRKMLTPTFHFTIIQDYFPVFVRNAEVLADAVELHVDGDYFDAFPYFKRCTLDIICETAMGIQVNAQLGHNNEYVHAVKRISEIVWNHMKFPWLWLKPIWYLTGLGFEFDRNVRMTNNFVRKVIQERKELLNEDGNEASEKKRKAFLDLLLTIQKEEGTLSDEDIREEVDTFMFEGHDTTSSGIGFTILWLGFYPECQKKLQKELDEVFGFETNQPPSMDDIKKCSYLEKCIKESLRMFPSVPLIARRLSEDVTINHPSGQKIVLPAGLAACVSPIAAARDPRAWPDPDTYNPDNFDIDAIAGRDPYAYIPFSAGPRNCIGQKFALLEQKTILSTFFRKYEVESLQTEENLRPVPELILRPYNGMKIKIKRREAADYVVL